MQYDNERHVSSLSMGLGFLWQKTGHAVRIFESEENYSRKLNASSAEETIHDLGCIFFIQWNPSSGKSHGNV